LIVVSVRGCAFTGYFPHAGVNNISQISEEADLMGKLLMNIDEILMKYGRRDGQAKKGGD